LILASRIINDLGGQLHAPAALSLEKEPPYPFDTRLDGPQSRFGCGNENKNPVIGPCRDILQGQLQGYLYPFLCLSAVVLILLKRTVSGNLDLSHDYERKFDSFHSNVIRQ
jgi:hypothetical protein